MGLWFMVQGSGFRVQGSGFRVQGPLATLRVLDGHRGKRQFVRALREVKGLVLIVVECGVLSVEC